MNQQELWQGSASAWIAFLEQDTYRPLLIDPPMLEIAGDVAGLAVCDVGCGEGRFSRQLTSRGAVVTAIDPCVPLLEIARDRDSAAYYMTGSGEALPVSSGQFDLVVSYLVLIDIANFRLAIKEMARILKPAGRLLVANLNPFCTTRSPAWVRDETGRALHVAVDDYFPERGELVSWCGIEVVNYHRPFEAYVQAFLAAGLQLTDFREPTVSAETAAESPKMLDARRVPFFHVMQWRKE